MIHDTLWMNSREYSNPPPRFPVDPVSAGPLGKKIDIWALGITLFCFIFGRCPFTANSEYELFQKLTNQR